MAISKEEKFANEMAELLFDKRGENGLNSFMTDKGNIVPLSYMLTVMGDQDHIDAIKKKIHDEILGHVTEFPREFKTNKDEKGKITFCYSSGIYDYASIIDEYIEDQYDELIEAQKAFDEVAASNARRERLQTNYRVVVLIERSEYDPKTGESTMSEESRSIVSICPELGIAEAVKYELVVNK